MARTSCSWSSCLSNVSVTASMAVSAVQKPSERRAFIGDGFRGGVVHLGVVLVDAEVGGVARMALKVVFEDPGGEGRERRIARSRRGRSRRLRRRAACGGQDEGQRDSETTGH